MLTIAANDNKKRKTVGSTETTSTPTVLSSSSDTLSYAAGMANTNGLIPYLTGQYNVDEAYMADFVKGFNEAINKIDDPSYNAYAAGTAIARMVKKQMLPSIENTIKEANYTLNREKFLEGFVASLNKDTAIFKQEAASSYFESTMRAAEAAKAAKLKEEGAKFLANNAKKEGVITTASGLQYKIITKGDGPIPTATQEVKVKYEGKLIDGTIFDSSYKRSDPITKFRCNQVIKGWTEALTMMPVGSTWELYIPSDLAYGEHGQGPIKPYSTLIFKVELVGIESDEPAKAAEPAKPAAKPATPAKKVVKKK